MGGRGLRCLERLGGAFKKRGWALRHGYESSTRYLGGPCLRLPPPIVLCRWACVAAGHPLTV